MMFIFQVPYPQKQVLGIVISFQKQVHSRMLLVTKNMN